MIVAEKLSCADMQRNVYNSEPRGHIKYHYIIGLMNQIIAWDDSCQARQQQSSYLFASHRHHIVITSSSVHYSHLTVSPAGTGYVVVKHKALEMIVAEKLSCADMQRNVYNSEPRGHIKYHYIIGLMNQIIAWDDSCQARQQQSSYLFASHRHHIVITSSSVHYSHLTVSPAGTGYVGTKH